MKYLDKIKGHRNRNKFDVLDESTCIDPAGKGYAASVQIRLSIDGISLEEIKKNFVFVDAEVLLATAEGSGVFPIFAYDCGCDTPEHNAYIYVEVEYSDAMVQWKNFYHLYYGTHIYTIEYDENTKKYTLYYTANRDKRLDLESEDGGLMPMPTPFVFERMSYVNTVQQVYSKSSKFEKELGRRREQE